MERHSRLAGALRFCAIPISSLASIGKREGKGMLNGEGCRLDPGGSDRREMNNTKESEECYHEAVF